MLVNPPGPPDIHSLIKPLDLAVEHVPDWLWQGVAANLISEALIGTPVLIWLAWKHREKIAEKLRLSQEPVLLSETAVGRSSAKGTLTVGSNRQILNDVRSTVGSERQALWNVKASTLPERLLDKGLELLSWYVRQR
jgi:hypothetical protein